MYDEFSIDKGNSMPIYIQIYNFFRDRIMSGAIPMGARLPSQQSLAEQFGVNRSTIVSAYDMLASDDLVRSNGKGGTRVINNAVSLNAPPPPNWSAYIHGGSYYANKSTVQLINTNEQRKDIYALTRPELSEDLLLPELVDEMKKGIPLDPSSLGYEDPHGIPALREALCSYYSNCGVRVAPDQILIVSGALQALYLLSVGILYKGSSILTESSSYIYSVNVFQSAGMRLFGIPTDAGGMIPEQLTAQYSHAKASLLYTIPNFNNPTGILTSESRKKTIYGICQEKNLPIIEDDTYRELYFTPERPTPLKALDNNELVLLVGSCSKVLFPGFRLGWIIGHKEVIDRLADIKAQVDLGTGTVPQLYLADLINKGIYEKHLEYTREALRKKRDHAARLLESEFSGLCEFTIPKGGVNFWLKLPKGVSASRLFTRALKARVLFCPGYIYSSKGSSYIRISFSYLSDKDLEQSLFILKHCITEEMKSASGTSK